MWRQWVLSAQGERARARVGEQESRRAGQGRMSRQEWSRSVNRWAVCRVNRVLERVKRVLEVTRSI